MLRYYAMQEKRLRQKALAGGNKLLLARELFELRRDFGFGGAAPLTAAWSIVQAWARPARYFKPMRLHDWRRFGKHWAD